MTKFKVIKLSPLKILAIAFCLFLMVLLIIKPDIYIVSAKNGLILFASAVLPALFPFFFFTTFLTKLGAAKYISKLGKKPFRVLYNAPPVSSYIFTMSILSGYPVGARLISDFYSNDMLTSVEATKCASFCSTSNPVFILGTVGTIIFNDIKIGLIIYIAHILSALLNGLLYRGRARNTDFKSFDVKLLDNCDNILSESIYAATNSMLAVGGFICIFTIFLDALGNIGVFSFFANMFSNAIPPEITIAFMSGAVEMTKGCFLTSALAASSQLKASLCCATISFGGLGILAQCITFLSRCRIKVWFIILQKITQSILSFAICYALTFFL
ncbi:MAG TPA: hypothetical protein VJZ69_04080 [Clostridia bacterium]|nr:hypothetical protein [Clostridia bacterium]